MKCPEGITQCEIDCPRYGRDCDGDKVVYVTGGVGDDGPALTTDRDHPCEIYGKSLDCQSRHLNNAVDKLVSPIKKKVIKLLDITTAWTSAFKKMRGSR